MNPRPYRYTARLWLLAWLALIPALHASPAPFAVQPASASSTAAAASIGLGEADTQLDRIQDQLDRIKQQISPQSSDGELGALYAQANQLGDQSQDLVTRLTAASNQARAALDVLGQPPGPDADPEPATVSQHRRQINHTATALSDDLSQATTTQDTINELARQIANQRRHLLVSTLASPSSSILSSAYWSPLFHPDPQDRQHLQHLGQSVLHTLRDAWQPGLRFGTAALILLGLAVYALGLRLLERGLTQACMRWLPGGRLRRSALAMATALSTVLAIGLAAQLLYLAFMRGAPADTDVRAFALALRGTAVACALVLGLGRALLSTRRPSWRLAPISDPIAEALAPIPAMTALGAMIFGTVEQLNATAGTSLAVTVFGNGLISMVLTAVLLIGLRRSHQVYRQMDAADNDSSPEPPLLHLLRLGIYAAMVVIVGALLLGYISLARFLVYEMIWAFIVVSLAYLLDRLATDICLRLLAMPTDAEPDPNASPASKALRDSWRAPLGTVLTAAIHVLLVVMSVMALFGGHFDNDPGTLIQNIINAIGGRALKKFNIMPMQLLDAGMALAVGLYLLGVCRRWLENDLLPKTRLDPGVSASLVMLVSNIGYVLVALATLNALGVEWNRLAWIVSALSVGIGFGLQEIVKNFISGLILLTERPIRVGDMVDLNAGVIGDVQRINVRATEIRLSDRSTVIVPNSQLISQNVRNVTMGHAQGVVTIPLAFPLDTDPAQVRELLLGCYTDESAILETPAPSVSFTELSPNGMTLSVTGYVASPRLISATKSALLFEILKRLREHGIALSSPQSMVIQNLPVRRAQPAADSTTPDQA